jgi:hypothetical protein
MENERKRMREAFECEHQKQLQEEVEIKQLDEQINTLRRLLSTDALASCTNST